MSETEVVMSVDECRRLLAATRVSRLAFVVDGHPRIVVLNHAVDGDRVVFQTSPDTAIAAATAGGVALPATLETDSASGADRSGWSVVASGRLAQVAPSEVRRRPTPWRVEATGVLLVLTVEELHGQHVGG